MMWCPEVEYSAMKLARRKTASPFAYIYFLRRTAASLLLSAEPKVETEF